MDDKMNFELGMQDELYSEMQQKGWYTAEQAAPQRTEKIRQKFKPNC